MKERGYGWWIDRLRWATRCFDYTRLDHFRGFCQFWEIPANEPTAIHGHWVDGPQDDLFARVREALGGLPFFAEDLGYITPDVHALRDRLKIPGMAVLQFGFGDAGAHIHLPHSFAREKVVYTGTHDNDTMVGWWATAATEYERQCVHAYLGPCEDGIHWAMIRAAYDSVANLCIVPLQDVLGLGSEARMNVPSLEDGNWRWRFGADVLRPELAKKLAALAEISDRLPQPLSATHEDWAA
jgi:4-alpha-glucanotransferase